MNTKWVTLRAAATAGAFVVGGLSMATPLAAFDHNRGGCKSAECLEKVRLPDVYGTAR
jgi:hypothetical protein